MENNENDFFPGGDEYKIPVTKDYLNKFEQGETTFRILSKAVIGYVYFNKENKPIRQKENFEGVPTDIKKDASVKHFWACVIWNYKDERIQILEITQKSIMTAMKALIDSPKWGSPLAYDISITRKGTTMNDTEYAIMPNPQAELTEVIKTAYAARPVNLEALFANEDPFKVA